MPEAEEPWQPSVRSLRTLLRLVELNAPELQAEGVTVSGAIYDEWEAVLGALYFAVFTHPFDDGQALELAPGVKFHRLGWSYPAGERSIMLVLSLAEGDVLLVDILVNAELRAALICHDPRGVLVEIPSAEIDRVQAVEFHAVTVDPDGWRIDEPARQPQ